MKLAHQVRALSYNIFQVNVIIPDYFLVTILLCHKLLSKYPLPLLSDGNFPNNFLVV